MKNMSKVMYGLSALMCAVAVFMGIENIVYIAQYSASYGVSLGSMWTDVLQYFIQGFFTYFGLAVLIFAAGAIIARLDGAKAGTSEAEAVVDVQEAETETTGNETADVEATATTQEAIDAGAEEAGESEAEADAGDEEAVKSEF